MTTKQWLKTTGAAIAALAMVNMQAAYAAQELVKVPETRDSLVKQYITDRAHEPALSSAAKIELLRKKVKYVFVLFQENRSFDQHFGTFPGANGLFSPGGAKLGFGQKIVHADGSVGTISPFLIPQTVTDKTGKPVNLYPADTDSIDHSHTGIDNSLDLSGKIQARNDRYALDEEGLTTNAKGQIVSKSTGLPPTANPTEADVQTGELALSHLDCDTIPFLWQYATRFTLLDNFHQTVIGPSTPNAIALIAGQSGVTQWALHPNQGSNNSGSPAVSRSGGEPVVGDPGPFPGSNLDLARVKPSYNPNDENPNKPALVQTYASLLLSFMGPDIYKITASDENPSVDLADVRKDIQTIAAQNVQRVLWAWFQEGYDHELTDGTGAASHNSYVLHHNGAQYFGYIGDNTDQALHLHGLNDFYSIVSHNGLPKQGGVFYVRGGYQSQQGLAPADPTASIKTTFAGDDDHPGYSDAQLSEALLAKEINTIARSSYWKDSAIIISYDETDGLYDHAPVFIRNFDPEGNALSDGPRIPTIVISPFARVHAIASTYATHNSVIKFIDELYNLVPLQNLPDEVRARQLGKTEFGQPDLAPTDGEGYVSDLTEAFDNSRLTGAAEPLPASYAVIPDAQVQSIPPYSIGGVPSGCYVLNIVPTDYANGSLLDPPPSDFNPRPSSAPGIPTGIVPPGVTPPAFPWTP